MKKFMVSLNILTMVLSLIIFIMAVISILDGKFVIFQMVCASVQGILFVWNAMMLVKYNCMEDLNG